MVLQILIDQTTPERFLMVNWLLGSKDPRSCMIRDVLPSGVASVNLTAGDWLPTVLLQQTHSFVDLRASLPRIQRNNRKGTTKLYVICIDMIFLMSTSLPRKSLYSINGMGPYCEILHMTFVLGIIIFSCPSSTKTVY